MDLTSTHAMMLWCETEADREERRGRHDQAMLLRCAAAGHAKKLRQGVWLASGLALGSAALFAVAGWMAGAAVL